jgi:hypothetical protein
VALAVGDVGLAVRIQESLEAAGHGVLWSAPLAGGPAALPGGGAADVVVLAESAGQSLAQGLLRWREHVPPPALLAVVVTPAGRQSAAGERVMVVEAGAPPREIAAAVDRALAMRWAGRLAPAYARGALGLDPEPDPVSDAARIVAAARAVDFDLVREALRGHADRYAAATDLVDRLREMRALEIPEVDLVRRMDGAHTLRTVIGGLSPSAARPAGRLVWALASTGALSLTPDPPDLATPERRAVSAARQHLRARQARVQHATHYDVLEVTPAAEPAEIDLATRSLALRFSPERLQALDLGDAAGLVAPLWRAVLEARAVLTDPAERLRYNDGLRARLPSLTSAWAVGPHERERAEQAHARGQRSLLADEPFKALSEMAAAARAHADHPDHEASLAWARYRAEVARGKPREAVARVERRAAEAALAGRRPWPRALVALALLCVADDDPEAARWHLGEALAGDPNHPAARQLLTRLTK